MRYLIHDSGEATTLKNGQILGDESPVEFDEDGRAGPLEDDIAEKLAAMDRHVELGERVRPDQGEDADSSEAQFDAAEFVDRTPMEDVIGDIESGDYDEHLDAIEEEASRDGVEDAVDERRE